MAGQILRGFYWRRLFFQRLLLKTDPYIAKTNRVTLVVITAVVGKFLSDNCINAFSTSRNSKHAGDDRQHTASQQRQDQKDE